MDPVRIRGEGGGPLQVVGHGEEKKQKKQQKKKEKKQTKKQGMDAYGVRWAGGPLALVRASSEALAMEVFLDEMRSVKERRHEGTLTCFLPLWLLLLAYLLSLPSSLPVLV